MGKPHVLVIPFPAQGHVIPLMSRQLAKQGIKLSFVNTEFNHKRVIDAFGKNVDESGSFHLVSIPDGLEDGEDRNQIGKLIESICQVMPGPLKDLIHKVNSSDGDKISCVLADVCLGWAVDVAAELGIPTAALCPASVSQLVFNLSIPNHIGNGLIDENGTPLMKDSMFQLSPTSPCIHPTNFIWLNLDNSPSTQKIMFDFMRVMNKTVETADWVLCNSSLELDHSQLPIGSETHRGISGQRIQLVCSGSINNLLVRSYILHSVVSLFLTKSSSKSWLWGLNSPTGHFFGWSEKISQRGNTMITHYSQGFIERVENRGKLVSWAQQVAVLEHSSIACFISHCGWNSTLEGVSNGVPLCWPYFADQFVNESYISDIWKVGLKFQRDERGTIGREEIQSKVEHWLVTMISGQELLS